MSNGATPSCRSVRQLNRRSLACWLLLPVGCGLGSDTGSTDASPEQGARVWDVGDFPSAVLQVGPAVLIAHASDNGAHSGAAPSGWIGRYGPDGNLLDTFAAALYDPTGLASEGDVLHVSHSSGVTSFSYAGGDVVGRLENVERQGSFRALCNAPEETVFVADQIGGRVVRADPRVGHRSAVAIAELPHVTGLAFDADVGRLYISTADPSVAPGRLWVLDADETTPAPFGDVRADFSALVLRGETLYASVRNTLTNDGIATAEAVLAIRADGALAEPLPHTEDLVNVGQVEVVGGDLLFVPEPHSGRVVITRLPTQEQ